MLVFIHLKTLFYNNIQFTSEVERLQSVLSSHIIKGGVIMAYFMEMKRLHSGIQLIYNMTVVMAFNFIMDSDVGVVILSEYLIFLKESHYLYWKFLFVCMDSVVIRNHFTPNQMFEDMKQVIDEIYKYQGTVCLNFHSNIINTLEFKKYKKIYIALVEYLSKLSNSK